MAHAISGSGTFLSAACRANALAFAGASLADQVLLSLVMVPSFLRRRETLREACSRLPDFRPGRSPPPERAKT